MIAQPTSLLTPFEKDHNTTATYFEAIEFYEKLADKYDQLELSEWGTTDAGYPLHVAVLSKNKMFDVGRLKKEGKAILFINNAIHPGEPEGVDATMMLVRDYLQKMEQQAHLENVVLVVIPFYNIGGGLNRSAHSRANQNGPNEYGFRGNARNLDLNRDFIKCDSKNAQTFNRIFNHWQPDVFIDNHTSNGADYQYTMTMLTTQEDKLGPVLGKYLREEFLPVLYKKMADQNWEMTPYVNVWGSTPDKGIPGFNDSPRYGSGYGSVHHVISFVPETHMLKPYPDRLKATYAFMDIVLKETNQRFNEIKLTREKAIHDYLAKNTIPIEWKIDRSRADTIIFKGYEADYKTSEVTGLDRLYYDQNRPFEKEIPYWNYFEIKKEINKPFAYLIPRAYGKIIGRLRWNGVEIKQLTEDISPLVEMYSIKNYEDRKAYEGHYLHYATEVEKKELNWNFYQGDYLVLTDQPAVRYIIETLEPEAPDSYFSWNFFDGILMQKEGFSAYVFEDKAAAFLKENPEIKTAFEEKKKSDPEFAKSMWAQLGWIYRQTPHYEKTHNLYPIARIINKTDIPHK
ncbi:MAG: M14 family metallopeptidase [Bacteroidota bacterium]